MGEVRFGLVGQLWLGEVWRGEVWRGSLGADGHGMEWPGVVRLGWAV